MATRRRTSRRSYSRSRPSYKRRSYGTRSKSRVRRSSGRSSNTVRIVIQQAPAVSSPEMIGLKPAPAPKVSQF